MGVGLALNAVEENLRKMEHAREAYWLRYPSTSPTKLRWRALTVRHSFHVLPGEAILEVGAGSGLWTEHLTSVLRFENPITAAIFNKEYLQNERFSRLQNVRPIHVEDLEALPPGSFDYIVGTAILCHDQYPQNLNALYRLLKPGGHLLFFENNYWNPQVFVKNVYPALGRWAGNASCRNAEVSVNANSFSTGLHSHRDPAIRHHPSASSPMAHKYGSIGSFHFGACAGTEGAIGNPLHSRHKARLRGSAPEDSKSCESPGVL
jgi:SAM-dependent methyltransferase